MRILLLSALLISAILPNAGFATDAGNVDVSNVDMCKRPRQGPPGPTGPQGPTGTFSAAFGGPYSLNEQVIAPGDPVLYDEYELYYNITPSAGGFTVNQAGVYHVDFTALVAEVANDQFELYTGVDGLVPTGLTYGTTSGTTGVVAFDQLVYANIGDQLIVRSPTGVFIPDNGGDVNAQFVVFWLGPTGIGPIVAP